MKLYRFQKKNAPGGRLKSDCIHAYLLSTDHC